jgi:hypothetical protein
MLVGESVRSLASIYGPKIVAPAIATVAIGIELAWVVFLAWLLMRLVT